MKGRRKSDKFGAAKRSESVKSGKFFGERRKGNRVKSGMVRIGVTSGVRGKGTRVTRMAS